MASNSRNDYLKMLIELERILCQFGIPNSKTLMDLGCRKLAEYIDLKPDVLCNIARRFGLPPSLIFRCAEWLCNTAETQCNNILIRKISQTVKYSLRKQLTKSGNTDPEMLKQILNFVLLAFDKIRDPKSKSQLTWVLGYIVKSLPADTYVSEIFEKFTHGDNICKKAKDYLADEIRRKGLELKSVDHFFEMNLENVNFGHVELPPGMRNRICTSYITQTQTATSIRSNHFDSEKRDILILDLVEVLKSKKESQKRLNFSTQAERLPQDENMKEGTDRWWFKDTYNEVNNMLKLARAKITLRHEDVNDYLCKKLLGYHYWTWNWGRHKSGTQLNVDITEIMLIYSKTHKLEENVVDKLVKCLAQDLKYFPQKELGQLRLNSIQALYNRSLKETLFSSETREKIVGSNFVNRYNPWRPKEYKRLDTIRQCLKYPEGCCKRSDIESVAYKILETYKSDKDEILLCQTALKRLLEVGNDNDLHIYVQALRKQTWDTNKSTTFFTKDVVDKIVKIVIEFSEYGNRKAIDCAVIIQDYLSFSSSQDAFSIGNVKKFVQLLNRERLHSELSSRVLHSLILALETKNFSLQLDGLQNIARDLISLIPRLDYLSSNYVILALAGITNKYSVIIPFMACLIEKLFDETCAIRIDNSIEFVNKDDVKENTNYCCISAYVANMFLKSLTNFKFMPAKASNGLLPIDRLLYCLEKNKDKQTRIAVAELFYRSLRHFPDLKGKERLNEIVGKILDFKKDNVADVRIYASAICCDIVSNYDVEINDEIIQELAGFFLYDTLILGDQDLTEEINNNIMIVLVKAARDGQNFTEAIFVLCNNILRLGIHYVDRVLEALGLIAKNKHVFPDETLYALENVLEKEATTVIFENCIRNGQEVPDKVIELFVEHLYNNEDATKRSECFNFLQMADTNQDLSDTAFDVLEMERAGRMPWTNTTLDDPSHVNSLNFLLTCVRTSKNLTIQNFELFFNMIGTTKEVCSLICQILNVVKENGNTIPDYFLNEVIRLLGPKMDSDILSNFCQLFLSVLIQEQTFSGKRMLKEKLDIILGMGDVNCDLFCDIFSVIFRIVEMDSDMYLNPMSANLLIDNIKKDTKCCSLFLPLLPSVISKIPQQFREVLQNYRTACLLSMYTKNESILMLTIEAAMQFSKQMNEKEINYLLEFARKCNFLAANKKIMELISSCNLSFEQKRVRDRINETQSATDHINFLGRLSQIVYSKDYNTLKEELKCMKEFFSSDNVCEIIIGVRMLKDLTFDKDSIKYISIENLDTLLNLMQKFHANKELSMWLVDIIDRILRADFETKSVLKLTTKHILILCRLFEEGTYKKYYKRLLNFIHGNFEISVDAKSQIQSTFCFVTHELTSKDNLIIIENLLQGGCEFDLGKVQKLVNAAYMAVAEIIQRGNKDKLSHETKQGFLSYANCFSMLILQQETNLFSVTGNLGINLLEVMEFLLLMSESIEIVNGNFLLACKFCLRHAATQPHCPISCYYDVIPNLLRLVRRKNPFYTSCVVQYIIGVMEVSQLRLQDLQPQTISQMEKFLYHKNKIVQFYCFGLFHKMHVNGISNLVFTAWCQAKIKSFYNDVGRRDFSLELNETNVKILQTICLVKLQNIETLKNVQQDDLRSEILSRAIFKRYIDVAGELDQYNFSVHFVTLSNNPIFLDRKDMFCQIMENLLLALDWGYLKPANVKDIVMYLNYVNWEVSLNILQSQESNILKKLCRKAFLSVVMEKLDEPIKKIENADEIIEILDGKITFEDTIALLNHIDSVDSVDDFCKTATFFSDSGLSLKEIKIGHCRHSIQMLKMLQIMSLTENIAPDYTKLQTAKQLSCILQRGFEFEKIMPLFTHVTSDSNSMLTDVSDCLAAIIGIIYQYDLKASDDKAVDCIKAISKFIIDNPGKSPEWLEKANAEVVKKNFQVESTVGFRSQFVGCRTLNQILNKLFNKNNNNRKLLNSLCHGLGLGIVKPKDYFNSVKNALRDKVISIGKQNKLKIVFANVCHQEISESQSCQKKCFDTKFENWSDKEYQTWAKAVKNNSSNYFSKKGFLEEALAVLKAAISKSYEYVLRETQILSCMLAILSSDRNNIKRGLLQQVVTGGGKSVIIQMLAILQALKGQQVFVVTSNSVLAKRDAQKSSKLFQLFNLSVDHNRDTKIYIRGPKNCYTKNVIFGDASQFQFDILRDEYSCLGTLAGCKLDVMIVDEVDSMFIDDSSKLARLASILPGMDQLELVYHFIWEKLNQVQSSLFRVDERQFLALRGKLQLDNSGFLSLNLADDEGKIFEIPDLPTHIRNGYDIEGIFLEIEGDILLGISDHLNNLLRVLLTEIELNGYEIKDKIKIPKHLQSFVEKQIPRWVENALTAFYYTENVHYIVHEGSIKPVDFDTTGVVQSSTSWSDGLHQFLQIKHNLIVTPETLATNYLSNVGFFKRFKKEKLFGFTGTFGSKAAKEAISDLYNVDLVLIPNSNHKKYFKYQDEIVNSNKEWLLAIKDSVNLEIKKLRAVLVICRTIRDAEIIHKILSDCAKRSNSVKLYTKNLSDEDKHVERVVAGEVIVATNLAGRGTDIKTEKTIEGNGGLHVIMTFLPATQRAEDQAIGRTSRINNVGTSQFILLNSNSVESTNREKRDENEKKILEEFRENEMKVIDLKDELFNQFCQLLKYVRKRLDWQKSKFQKLRKSLFSQTVASVYDKNILGAIEEEWALFVRSIESQPLKTPADQVSVKSRFSDFENKILGIFNSSPDEYYRVIESPFYAISIGNDFMNNGNSKKAMKYFDYAIEKDENFSAAAYLGKAWCLVQPETRFWYFNEQHVSNYKNEAVKALSQSMKLLETEKTYLSITHAYAVKNSDETDLTNQLLEKCSILGNYMSSIEAAITQVKTSQRLVDITFTRKNFNNYLIDDDFIISEEHKQMERKPLDESQIPKFASEYKIDLAFHDLTVRYDTTVKIDQAEKFIDSFEWECPMRLRLIENFANLYSAFLSPDIEYNTLPKTRVVEMLSKNSGRLSSILANLPLSLTPINRQIVKFDCTLIKEDDSLPESFFGLSEEAFTEKVNDADESTFFTFKILDGNKEVGEAVRNVLFDISLSKVTKEDALGIFQAGRAELVSLKTVGKTVDLIEFCKHPFLDDDDDEDKRILLHVVKDNGNIETTEMPIKNVDTIQQDISCVEIKISALGACELFRHKKPMNLLFDVSFKNINLEMTQKILKLHKGTVSLVIITKTKELTKKIIPLLRENNIEFALQFLDLDLTEANELLKSDCIEEEDVKVQSAKRLPSLYLHDHDPKDIHNFMARGIEYLLIFDEKRFVPWYAVASVCFLGALQVSFGGVLITTGLGAPFGMALLTEGSVDLMVAYRAYSNRNFTWRDYTLQKSLSLLISFSTLGVSGAGSLIQGVGTEAAEQGTVQLILHGKEIATAAAGYGKSLFSLAFKQAGVSVAEAAAREGLFQLSGTVSNVIFQSFESDIESSISRSLKLVSAQTPLLKLLARICVLEKYINRKGQHRVKTIISNFLKEIVSPENNYWKTQWNSIGMMICQGVASSSSQALNNPIMLGGRLLTMLLGSIEIANMEKNLCEELVVKLQKYEISCFSLPRAVELICNLSISDARIFTNVISSNSGDGAQSTFYEYLMSDEYRSLDSKQVSEFRSISEHETLIPLAKAKFSKFAREILEALHSKEKSDAFDLNSELLALIVGAASQQIVHISQAQLITPVSTLAIGHFVRKVSNYVQATCIISEAENSDSQNKNLKAYDELVTRFSKGETLSEDERTFMDSFKNNRSNLTVANQIYHNANDLHLAKNLQAIGRDLTNAKVEKVKNLNATKYAQSVRSDGKKAGLSEIVHLTQVHNVNLVITDNHEDVESLAKQYKNRSILVYSQEKEYQLYDSSGNLVNMSDTRGSMDKGYKILEHLTNKKEGELRNRMASDILSHGEGLWVKIEAEQMLHRYGGGKRPSAQGRASNSLSNLTKIMNGVEELVKRIPSSKAKKVPSNSNRNQSQNLVSGVGLNDNNAMGNSVNNNAMGDSVNNNAMGDSVNNNAMGINVNNNAKGNNVNDNVNNNNEDVGTCIALDRITVLPSFLVYIICNIVILQNIVALCTFYIICCHYYGRHGNPDNDVD